MHAKERRQLTKQEGAVPGGLKKGVCCGWGQRRGAIGVPPQVRPPAHAGQLVQRAGAALQDCLERLLRGAHGRTQHSSIAQHEHRPCGIPLQVKRKAAKVVAVANPRRAT